ncbi:hypothetical protein [Streptomyces decoyicus]
MGEEEKFEQITAEMAQEAAIREVEDAVLTAQKRVVFAVSVSAYAYKASRRLGLPRETARGIAEDAYSRALYKLGGI